MSLISCIGCVFTVFDPELNPEQGRLAWSLIIVFVVSRNYLSRVCLNHVQSSVQLLSQNGPHFNTTNDGFHTIHAG